MPIPIILDCDPGHDDAAAILAAASFGDLMAITTVAGNAPVDETTTNALLCCAVFGLDVPVYRGSEQPLVRPASHAASIHGLDGLGGHTFADAAVGNSRGDAVEFLASIGSAEEPPWIVATGPLTNIAHALAVDPLLPERVAGIAVMGGGIAFGNWTPYSEFNIWCDPEAASIVFDAPFRRRVLVPLDATHGVLVRPEHARVMRQIGTTRSQFMAELYEYFIANYQRVFFDEAVAPLHDACAVFAVLSPECAVIEELNIRVMGGDGDTRGMLLADRRGVRDSLTPNVEVVMAMDADLVISRLEEAAGGASST